MGAYQKFIDFFTPAAFKDEALISHQLKAYTAEVLSPARYSRGSAGLGNHGYNGGEAEYFFDFKGNVDYKFNYKGHADCVKAYKHCPPLNAIINRKAQAYINGKTWVLNTAGKESTSPEAKKLRKLLAQPNPLQSWKQFEAQGYIYQQLFGFNVVLPIKPVGFKENIDAAYLWNIPPFMIEIKESSNLFYQSDLKSIIDKIYLTYKGKKTELDLDEVFIMKDNAPNFDSLVIPTNRVQANALPINNIIATYMSRHILISQRGPMFVVSSDKKDSEGVVPLKNNEREALQKDFMIRYGLSPGQSSAIITNAAVKVQTVGFSTKDLMMFEEIEDDIERLCDGWNYPHRLMSGNHANSLGGSDAKEFEAQLYNNGIIPDASSNYEQWSAFFKLTELNLRLDKDYSHVPALQKNKLELAHSRHVMNQAKKIEFESGLITLNQWLIALEEDPIAPELGDVRYMDMKNTGTPLALVLGQTGVQSLLQVLSNSSLSAEAKQNILEILFGIAPADAARMVIQAEPANDADEESEATGNPQDENTSNENE